MHLTLLTSDKQPVGHISEASSAMDTRYWSMSGGCPVTSSQPSTWQAVYVLANALMVCEILLHKGTAGDSVGW